MWVWRVVAGACAVGTVALVLTAVLVDLESADKAASVVGAVVALAGLVVSVWQITAVSTGGSQDPPGAVQVHASGAQSLAVGGDVIGSAIGKGSKVVGQPPVAPGRSGPGVDDAARRDVRASGDGSRAIGGTVSGSAFGLDSEVR
ncbi:hypothetical protein FB465_6763 [Kitasatospora atroaurantiaca]|uniref:Uncharacterized protein n=1 Tax=Kitasatospora atroaurantiaca TaxID=285545 RepID=A0A561F133_9ACTN|nr:hypothetical protein FB465_6763 [Kitasatospora atroaurantiaca]